MRRSFQHYTAWRISGDHKAMINRIVGTPWVDLGRDLSGMDCLGLVIYYYREGLDIEISDPVSSDPKDVLDHSFFEEWDEIENPEKHCVVSFSDGEGRHHLGVMTPHGVLHTGRRTHAILTPLERFRMGHTTFYRHKKR